MDAKRKALWMFIVGGLLVTFALAFFVSPYASGSPDGLNKVAEGPGVRCVSGGARAGRFSVAGYEVKGSRTRDSATGCPASSASP